MSKTVSIQLLEDDINRCLINSHLYITGSGVSGDIAEFGTMTGRTANVLAQFLVEVETQWSDSQRRHGIAPRNLHLFDSFIGLPTPSAQADLDSPHVKAGLWDRNLCRGISAQELRSQVQRHLPAHRVKIYEGWFSDTLSQLPPETRFALVHVDSDFYESAIQVLDHLFKHQMVSPGAMILFDDWYSNLASPEMGEQKAWHEVVATYKIRATDLGCYSAFGHRFIVHSYE